MKIKDMQDLTNKLIGQGVYEIQDLLSYFDECIYEINVDLGTNLPTVSDVYKNEFSKTDTEAELEFFVDDRRNPYTRIPRAFIHNYICYDASWKILRDEDEDQEVYVDRARHADRWRKRLLAHFSDFHLRNTESILLNGDIDNTAGDPYDDTALGFYNPYSITGDE